MHDSIPSGSSSVKWNAVGLVAKQAGLLGFAVILAAIIGPHSYGVLAQAQIFIVFTALLLDQGLSSVLVQRRQITPALTGAVSGLNLALALVMAGALAAAAPFAADFFDTPALAAVLTALGVNLVVKGAAVVPRALLLRNLRFRVIAIADSSAVLIGGAVALAIALSGGGVWALVVQIAVVDLVTLAVLFPASGRPLPNLRVGELRDSLGFSVRVFLSNLVSYASRNSDNILIGRFEGAVALGHYGLAYRVLLTPIQMLGQVVVQVLFPHVSRIEGDRSRIGAAITKSLRTLAVIVFPMMACIGVSAPQSVPVVLGEEWVPAVPLLMILSFTGARQALTALNSPILMAAGRADVLLRFSLVAALLQVGGIIAGLPWGVVGVAWGYTIGGLVMTPAVVLLARRFGAVSLRDQAHAVLAPLHATAWLVADYLAISALTHDDNVTLVLGLATGLIVYLAVLGVSHRRYSRVVLRDLVSVARSTA